MSLNGLTPLVAHEIVADGIRAAERHRRAAESRATRGDRRSPIMLLSRLRSARRRTVVPVPARAEG